MRAAIEIFAVLFALNSPMRPLIRLYLRVFLLNVVILNMFLLIPALNQWSKVYAGTYWFVVTLHTAMMLIILWTYGKRMLTDPVLRMFSACWALMALFYCYYAAHPQDTRLDWLPTAIFASAFIAAGAWSRLERRKERSELFT